MSSLLNLFLSKISVGEDLAVCKRKVTICLTARGKYWDEEQVGVTYQHAKMQLLQNCFSYLLLLATRYSRETH